MEIIGYLASVFIGITLGLVGGGGSILTVPILVYLFQIKPELATSYSLCIVGITALVGTYRHYRFGNLQFKTALYFAIPSIITLLLIRKFVLPALPDNLITFNQFILTKSALLMIVFACLMIMASYSMIRKKGASAEYLQINYVRLMLIGAAVGCVTGFLGAGGGFLIIPALVFFAGLPMKQAVGTSLLIITINSFVGFTGDLINGVQINLQFLVIISLIAILGMLIGSQLSKKIPGAKLKPAFGWFVLVMGAYIILHEVLGG